MNAELEEYKRQRLPRARRIAVIFGICSVLVINVPVYLYIKVDVNDQKLQEFETQTTALRKRADQAETDVIQSKKLLDSTVNEISVAVETFQACLRLKKK